MQVLFGITNPELDILDTFEDVEYERRTVEVSLMVSVMKIHLIAFRASFTDLQICILGDLEGQVDVQSVKVALLMTTLSKNTKQGGHKTPQGLKKCSFL